MFNAIHIYVLNLVCCVFMFFLVGWISWPMVSAAKDVFAKNSLAELGGTPAPAGGPSPPFHGKSAKIVAIK